MERNNRLYLTSDEEVTLDDNYRYIVKPMEISHGKRKGKNVTFLDNFVQFCDSIQMSNPTLLARIIGTKLSCRVDMSNDTYSLIGFYTTKQVKDIVYEFIRTHLLCKSCDKPEVDLRWSKSLKCCKAKCMACGVKQLFNSQYDNILCNL